MKEIDTGAVRKELEDFTGRTNDPLAKHEDEMNQWPVDPFDLYIAETFKSKDRTQHTIDDYYRTYDEWKDFMDREDRHPSCANQEHVESFVDYLLSKNSPRTVKQKLGKINQIYTSWQNDNQYPHEAGFNPIEVAQEDMEIPKPDEKDQYQLGVAELRSILEDVTHIQKRAIIAMQLKLGLRATELCNVELSEIDIQNDSVKEFYPDLGTHPRLQDHPNAVFIPADRPGNKSHVGEPRVLPIDDELRRTIMRYLLLRPAVDAPHLLLTRKKYKQMKKADVNDVWKGTFHPEYAETDHHRPVTSHYGRHRFTTYWRVEQDVNRQLVKYMRGDKIGRNEAIDQYLHTYYDDIESLYRKNIYKIL